MKERERLVVTSVLSVLLLAWLGFLLHRSPRFPGSGVGLAFGIAAAVLMLVPLVYPIAKRIPALHDRIVRRVSMQTLLSLHVYVGILAPLLAIIHTGHKFDSGLGITLTAVVMLVVVSGFAVRYLLTYVSHDMTDKLALLQTARGDLDSAWGVLENAAAENRAVPTATLFSAGLALVGLDRTSGGPAADVVRIAESVADLEYSMRMDALLKLWFRRSLSLHIALSVILYVLLALHIGSGLYFGLRALQ